MQRIGAATPSPDGRWVAYTQSRLVLDTEKSETNTQIFLAAADGSSRKQLTREAKSAHGPSFSPDGRYVYFVSSRTGTQNLWRLPLNAGEAEMVTDLKDGMGAYSLSPNGKWIAITRTEPPADAEKRKREKLDYRIVDDSRYNSLWLVPVEPSEEGKRLPKKIVNGHFQVGPFDWSPDSKQIAFETLAPDFDWKKSDISEVDIESGQTRVLAGTPAAEYAPRYSPDGRYLAFLRSSVPPRWARDERIVLLPRDGGPARELPATDDVWPTIVGWTADSQRILFTEMKGVHRILLAMPVEGAPSVVYHPGKGYVSGAWTGRGPVVAFTQESSGVAPEAYVLRLDGKAPVCVSRVNADLQLPPIGETRAIRWKSVDGLQIEGLLTLPVGYEDGKRYPLVLVIHGGPANAFEDSYLGSPVNPGVYPMASFSSQGYAILRPNIRGSSGYGKKFRHANIGDWGGKDYEDAMAGVDHAIAMGIADSNRLAIIGASYGGFMANWIVGHTNRFKVAASFAGVSDLVSFTGTTDIPDFLPDWFGAEPWQNTEMYRAHSPLSYAGNIRTPLLITHGDADVRVPIGQGYELYSALKRRGVPTEMVAYPRTGHGSPEPKLLMDLMQRHLDWLEKYLR